MIWRMAVGGERCGGAKHGDARYVFAAGQPLALVTEAKKIRCPGCVGVNEAEAVRLTLEQAEQPKPFRKPDFSALRDVAQAFDHAKAAAGDRD